MKRIVAIAPALLIAGLFAAAPAQARNYDCSKAGNANKAVCKGQAAATPAPAAPTPATKSAPTARHYDCSKAGNANKSACKGAAAAPAAPAPSAAPAPAPAVHRTTTTRTSTASTSAATTNAAGPNGATAKCRDGSLSFSAHRAGTCSRHGGVATWF